jgi:2,3-bisphosphoglycerate-independent phosphoglycerate mutase
MTADHPLLPPDAPRRVIVIPDGAADAPQQALGGRTPLAAARTPAMDALAARGVVGITDHVPESLHPGSEVACMSLLGYDPLECFTGRAPLEAAAQAIALGPHDWAVRCNLVTIDDRTMIDFTAGHASTDEAADLLAAAQKGLAADFPGLEGWEFRTGVSYRNLLLYRGDPSRPAPLGSDLRTTPPHDLMDQPVTDAFPRGTGSRLLAEIMTASAGWLSDHPVNRRRIAAGQRPATHLWLWGAGRTPAMRPFAEVYGGRGAMITAVDLLRGLAALAGWDNVSVPGATGYLDTDYAAKGRFAIDCLRRYAIVCVHVEAPDEASHQGQADEKVLAIERIDAEIVAPLVRALAAYPDHRILVCPDHPTLLSTKTHSRGGVPFVMAGSTIEAVLRGMPATASGAARAYHEQEAARSGVRIEPGWRLMGTFLSSSGT